MAAAGHLHRGGVGVVVTRLRAVALAARLHRHIVVLLRLVAVLRDDSGEVIGWQLDL